MDYRDDSIWLMQGDWWKPCVIQLSMMKHPQKINFKAPTKRFKSGICNMATVVRV